MQLETDASEYTIGGVLLQVQKDNSWRPLAYLSKTMNKTERNYEIYDRELLVIMEGLKQWQQYLIGSNQFEIWTDHKNLGYFKKPQKLNCHQAQWITELQEYDFCHDLAKWLSYYVYFFFFSFLFFSYWTYNYKMEHGKVSHDFVTMSQWCDGWSGHRSQSQCVT